MDRFPILAAAVVALSPLLLAASPTPKPHAKPPITVHKIPVGNAGHGLRRSSGMTGSANGPVPSSACMERAAAMPASAGTIRPNGPTKSKTLVEVPLAGGNVATQTRNAQIADACNHLRR